MILSIVRRGTTQALAAGVKAARDLGGRRHRDGKVRRLVGDIPLGGGAVITIAGEPVAVYRTPNDTLRVTSAVCPHLNALVEFDADGGPTWRCPRHGARFATDGSLVDGRRIVDEPLVGCPNATRVLRELTKSVIVESAALRHSA